MPKGLIWKFCWAIAVAALILYWLFSILSRETEQRMSFLAPQHRATLLNYAKQAEEIYRQRGEAALGVWLEDLQERENTWVAVVRSDLKAFAGSKISDQFLDGFGLGRSVDWKIHLYFEENPIMELPFLDANTHFLIRLPKSMRPGAYWPHAQLLFQILFPLLLVVVLSVMVYRHVKLPLRRLEKVTRRFTNGEFDVRASAGFGKRTDELAGLANTFDRMAERTGNMILMQRQLLADLSHELRTPLARMDLAIASIEHGIHMDESVQRLYRETAIMSELVEDALTLAWLNNEQPQLRTETVDLVDLLNCVIRDAQFEFQDRHINSCLLESAKLEHTNLRALNQVFENVLRNGLRHTPVGGEVWVRLWQLQIGHYRITVRDQGPGVPGAHLNDIFKPFFRLNKARSNPGQGSYGLGLALVQRNLRAVSGQIFARNIRENGRIVGLEMVIDL